MATERRPIRRVHLEPVPCKECASPLMDARHGIDGDHAYSPEPQAYKDAYRAVWGGKK